MIDCQFRSDFAGAVPANSIRKHSKQNRDSVFGIEHKRCDGITVFIILARHTRMGLCIDVQVSVLCADHKIDLFLRDDLRLGLSRRLA